MKLLEKLEYYAVERKNTVAFRNAYNQNDQLTYGELKEYSDKLATYIRKVIPDDGRPIIVYGHKHSSMLYAFLGCVKSGHPYCPIDISIPLDRVAEIINIAQSNLVINTFDEQHFIVETISSRKMSNIVAETESIIEIFSAELHSDKIFYIIFTSGSTGVPKGVEITSRSLDNFLTWMKEYFDISDSRNNTVFLNQAPFSFDLSVMDIYTSLFVGGTIWSLDKKLTEDMDLLMKSFSESNITIWVSTPSFLNLCLFYRGFNSNLLKKMNKFIFCGEVLPTNSVIELFRRFPRAKVFNTYGPTESTVAVTGIEVTRDMLNSSQPLPIGIPKSGSNLYIIPKSGSNPYCSDYKKGEIYITGDTLAKGYLNQPELTKERFVDLILPNGQVKAYKTGDEGYFCNGMLYYCGRLDFQIKLNGYRIELGEIENSIVGLCISNVINCVVLPFQRDDKIIGLVAFIFTDRKIEDEFSFSQAIRTALSSKLPNYMIPSRYIFMVDIPITSNGKIDRKALESRIL